jgi:hypothetical protein
MEKELKKQKLDMLNGSIWNKLPVFALPIIATNTPPITDTTIEVCTAFCTVCLSSRPIAFAITTFAPSAMPINKLSISPMIGLFAPTAATAAVLSVCAKLPTIAISDALKSCSSIPVAAIGSALLSS